jgi:glycosyltransferase involved in cell wall biosynthesis
MLLSVVTGSYNRLPLLQAMIASVRRYLHFGLSYEIIVVDGGSTDGTIAWCKAQSDVRLIEHGGLLGAIRAFSDGAYAARGEVVLLANDDVELIDYSLLAAIAYLQEHPTCGAVAFSDDRAAIGKPAGYHVQTMTVLNLENQPVSIPYAQVGLYRRWLGDLCGWWGAHDPTFTSHTYGGDNYLTARIVEHGYTVDAVDGVRVKDIVANDGLREHNTRTELSRPSSYYQRFTTPPQMKAHPTVSNPEHESGLRILYLPIFESKIYPHHRPMKRGLREALQRMGQVIEIDYLNEPYDLVEIVRAWQPNILFTQCQRDLKDLTAARAAQPDMLVLNWNGDVYLDALVSPDTLSWLKANVDVQLMVNGAALPVYAEHGIPAAYWQCAYEPVNGDVTIADEDAYEIVLMGSAYSEKRRELARLLCDLPHSVGLVGSGWVGELEPHNAGNTTYQFELSNAIRRSAKIEVGDNQYEKDTGFVSNRIFDCLASGGALLLHQRVDRLEEFTGLKAGVHYVEWTDFDDLCKKISYYMAPKNEKKRARIVSEAYAYVCEHHSFDARLKQLFTEILPRVL